jgi:hypothetical protein
MRYQDRPTTFNAHNRRARRIESVQQRLLLPRLQVSLILLVTAFAGFLTSFLLLSQGVLRMWLRYPIAILVAYCVFLGLLALWVWLQRRTGDADLDFDLDLDFPDDLPSTHEYSFDAGDDYGGDEVGGSCDTNLSSSSGTTSGGSGATDGIFDLDLGEGEGILIVIALAAMVAGAIASFYVIYIAPVLLAEILVDGVLVVSLYKRVKRIEHRHWLRAAVRHTVLPALLVSAFFTVAGYLLQQAIPEAHTMGEVWSHIRDR